MISATTILPFEPFLSLWRHRELFRRVLVRDIQSSFRGSVLGLAWIVVIPLTLVAIYSFVFGSILNSSWAIQPRSPYEVPLIYFSGLMVFGFFMETITRSTTHIRDQKTYVTKIIFPVDILCWVLVGTALFKFFVNLVLLLTFITLLTGAFPVKALLLPLLMVPFVLLTVGLAWILAGVGAFIRDLSHALQALGPVIMFISPVFYAAAQVPEAARPFYFINPLTFMLESVRGLLFFDQAFSLQGYLAYSAAALVVFSFGYAFFQRLRPGFADVV
ncbi:MAG: ABC transporter permease [Mesorhizobium sp.]|nr:ABC transporter permease [Mesorhizobium sp.]